MARDINVIPVGLLDQIDLSDFIGTEKTQEVRSGASDQGGLSINFVKFYEGEEFEIGQPGQRKLHIISVPMRSKFTFETRGESDTQIRLFDFQLDLVGEDDDGGQDLNAKLTTSLDPGAYILQVTLFDDAETGSYKLRAFTA